MPMVYAGHVSHVMWLHPYWAQQIKEGEHSMCVGRDSSTTTIRVTSTDDYFLSDGLYVPQDHLENPKPLRLSVIQVNPMELGEETGERAPPKRPRKQAPGAEEVGTAAEAETCNDRLQPPGGSRDTVRPNGGGDRPRAYSPQAEAGSTAKSKAGSALPECNDRLPPPGGSRHTSSSNGDREKPGACSPQSTDELQDCVERRVRQLEDLETAFADLIDDDGEETLGRWATDPRRRILVCLGTTEAFIKCKPDESERGDEEEIQRLVRAVCLILQALPKPTLVTVSRSSLDEYCPPGQVDSIQNQILSTLESLYGTLAVHREYETTADMPAASS
ncbi:hypothetical protein JZ751_000969 [Albula glossodonta]|uniref:Uncharacterized protein n=1 Tax=Albula glossodonta TaxID=121402 RepID=A0A8T2PXP0_9TELE|nr:hypothetical protein JZ751_000969 [Albula glossodonta]